jgi:hypothetical protein
MSIISHIHLSQKKKIHHFANNTHAVDFLALLSDDELALTIENNLPNNHRERIYTPTKTLSMFLAQTLNEDRSCSKAVNDMLIQTQSVNNTSANTAAYCKARKRLSLPLLTQLVNKTGELIHRTVPQQWHWFGRSVSLIDGTSLTMPDTKSSQAEFPQQCSQKAGLGFPICRLLAVSCLHTGVILNAAVGPFKGKGSDEQSLLRQVLDTFQTGNIVVGDAFFGTYFLLAEMIKRGVDVLFEQHGSRKRITDFGKGMALGKKDHLIDIPKSKIKPDWMTQKAYEDAPNKLTIRELKVGQKTIITTMLSAADYPKKALAALYQKRWHVEVDFRNIKTTLGMNILSCKTPEMCRKEIWTYFLANNLIRLFMSQAAFNYDLLPRQLSFKHAVQVWLTYALLDKVIDEHMLALLAKRQVGKRAGRFEPRAVKRRPKAYPLLMIPRAEAKKAVMKNGHPKKIK